MPLSETQLNALLRKFFEHALLIKLFHFQTERWGAHKASDDYYGKFQAKLDRFMEVAQGEVGTVTVKHMPLQLETLTDSTIDAYLGSFARVLEGIKNSSALRAIRDEMLADLYQFRYLLTFD
jgi:hypothetical protein